MKRVDLPPTKELVARIARAPPQKLMIGALPQALLHREWHVIAEGLAFKVEEKLRFAMFKLAYPFLTTRSCCKFSCKILLLPSNSEGQCIVTFLLRCTL